MKKGKELLIMRVTKGLRAKEIAKRMGVSNTYISLMENELKPIPLLIYKKWVNILEEE